MNRELRTYLYEIVKTDLSSKDDVDERKMFGCEAFFRCGEVFALIWKTGRIGLKFRDSAEREKLLAMPGAEQWTAGKKVMREWILLPETLHDLDGDRSELVLRAWRAAHLEN